MTKAGPLSERKPTFLLETGRSTGIVAFQSGRTCARSLPQRMPPDRFLAPPSSARSTSSVRMPFWASRMAAAQPANPAPTTMHWNWLWLFGTGVSRGGDRWAVYERDSFHDEGGVHALAVVALELALDLERPFHPRRDGAALGGLVQLHLQAGRRQEVGQAVHLDVVRAAAAVGGGDGQREAVALVDVEAGLHRVAVLARAGRAPRRVALEVHAAVGEGADLGVGAPWSRWRGR